MKYPTADQVLRETFAHLDRIVKQKNKQIRRATTQKKEEKRSGEEMTDKISRNDY